MMVSQRIPSRTPASLSPPMGPNLAPEVANSGAIAPADSPWRRSWYPVAYLADLDRNRPTPFTLLGDDLVLWWDGAAKQWRAFADVCPHRLVPLSEGRLNGTGELECPYHGWTFRGDGHCTAIPQASQNTGSEEGEPSRLLNPRSHCRTYATATGQGLLFVFAGDPKDSADLPLPLVPQLEEPLAPGERPWTVQDTFRDLPYDALTLLENVLDVSHVPFTHHGTVGRRENAGPVELKLLRADADGFSGLWEEGPRRGKLGRQNTTFKAPCLMWHDLTAPAFARILTVVYVTPIGPGCCRIFARFPFQFRSPLPAFLLRLRPIWLQHLANHVVLEDDQLFLHWQERVLAQRGGSANISRSCYLASQADRYVLALHQWVVDHGGSPFPGAPLPPRQDQQSLMERYHTHTAHCRACSGALTQLRFWRPWLEAVPWLALLAVAWWHTATVLIWAIGLTLLSWLTSRQFTIWEGLLHQGNGKPPRNRR
ncbi:MAG: Rieske 2Fe-2S domain-containing protein [Cyanobacteriota bacterium]|nr:Rieske 2Fe-2S domain-containing protein [Cyanobacteriota bacterium]